jgi:uncharacterized protein YbaA (DUF1428 family)
MAWAALLAVGFMNVTFGIKAASTGSMARDQSSPRELSLSRLFLRDDVGFLSGESFLGRDRNKEVLMSYVDGFVVPVSRDKIDAYKAQARKAGEIWKEHGALAFVECIGDDVPYGTLTSFPRAVQAKDDEVVVFSWIIYRSRAERDQINQKVMADPRLKGDMPFDGKRLIYGGFEMWLEM